MFKNMLTKVLGDPNEKQVKRLQPLVSEINELEQEMQARSDDELRALTEEFKTQIREVTAEPRARRDEIRKDWEAETEQERQQDLRRALGQAEKELRAAEEAELEEILPSAFAAVREAARRTIGLRHYDVQLIGGMVLHQGKVAEMKTGEGKTLVATLPVYLNALVGRGVHIITVNDYLAKRDTQWMGPIYHLLGLNVGVIQSAAANPDLGSFLYDPDYQANDDRYQRLRPIPRREAYAADITYGTNNEFGFDYLRDNMVWDLLQRAQRELHYGIVDEVDNVLIDEARTPLIISGQADESSDSYQTFARLVPRLRPEEDYAVDEKMRVATLTEEGTAKIESALGISNLYSPEHFDQTPYLDNALRAHVLYKKDRDYIVKDGEVIIVDEFTGRLMYGRRYSEGLHQAIEAKEGVRIQRESLTLATITFQNYFRMYHKLAGMTGTAATEAEEFGKIYNLEVVAIPTHKPMVRQDYPDQVYKSPEAKFRAVVHELEELYRLGRPVLVGTIAIETSEYLSGLLERRGVAHQVLNAKQHEKEAGVIAQAGRSGTVTIATNMAGRGVDILLGGNPEGLARDRLRKEGIDLTLIPQDAWSDALLIAGRGEDPAQKYPERWAQVIAETAEMCRRDREKVLSLGGLHILGTERHEARRIDNQLRGRAGRQGDPGSSRFYLSLGDDLMRRFGGENVARLMERLGVEDDVPIEHSLVSKAIENAQVKVEGYNFDIRKHVLEYDNVVNKQREVIYEQRRRILGEPTLKPTILEMAGRELKTLVQTFAGSAYREEWDLKGLVAAVGAILPVPVTAAARWATMNAAEVEEDLLTLAEQAYTAKEAELGPDLMRQAERLVMLRAVDSRWVRHLTDLDSLREGIGLRAYGQQDPLVAYKREAHEMYQQLLVAIQSDIVHSIFHTAVQRQPVRPAPPVLRTNRDGQQATSRPATARKAAVPAGESGAAMPLGRNDLCWCGSGKKYKHCHMQTDRGAQGGSSRPVAAGSPQPAKTGAGPGRKQRQRR